MQRGKGNTADLIGCALLILLAFFLVVKAYFGQVYYGEIDSNALPVISLQYRGSIFMQQSDIELAQKDFPNLYKKIKTYEDLRCSKLLKISEDKWMAYYFPIYPFLCIPVKLFLNLIGANQERCFEITNVLLIIGALYFVLKRLKGNSMQRLLATIILALSPAVLFYVNYICYEVFVFAMLIISLVQYSNKKYKLSAFALALGGMSNPAVMAVGIVMVCEYLGKILYNNKGIKVITIIRDNFKEVFLYGLCYVPCLIPFLVQRIYLKASVYGITSNGLQGSTGRALAYLFDPSLGICSFAPLAILAFFVLVIVAIVRKCYHAIVWLMFLVGTVMAVSFMTHINCGMVYCARYVAWIYPIVPVFLATEGFYILKTVWSKLACYCLIIISTVAIISMNYGVRLYYFNNCTEWLLNYVPGLYNPLSATFYCRTLHEDGGYSHTEPAYHKNARTDEITKLIYKADDGSKEQILNDVTGDKDSLYYLEKEIDKYGSDGRFHYVNFPSWTKYKIFEKDLSEKEHLVESTILLDERNFHLNLGHKKQKIKKLQKKRFPIEVSADTFYKIELELAEDFDFSQVQGFKVEFSGENFDNEQAKESGFLVNGRYDYTIYFNSGKIGETPEKVYVRIVAKTKSMMDASLNIRKLCITEMKKET